MPVDIGTKSYPATYVFRVENFEEKLYDSAVHFFKDTVELNSEENQILLPKLCQRFYLHFSFEQSKVIDHIKQWLRPRVYILLIFPKTNLQRCFFLFTLDNHRV